jgi:nitrite reductase/ring-hydroxylating ferredoxin subunit
VTDRTSTRIDVCPAADLPAGEMRLLEAPDGLKIGVFNCGGALYAIEDRCSHDDGPLARASSTRPRARSSARATGRCST